MKRTTQLIVAAAGATLLFAVGPVPHSAAAQTRPSPAITYTTEGLWNTTTGTANWINILNAAHSFDLWWGGSFNVDLLAVNNLRNSQGKAGVADDLHIFSAIEDESVALSLFEFGLTQDFGMSNVFLGVRNVNKDYFTSPWNSIFTSSVGGLFPTLAANFPISDSPRSAMCLHSELYFTERLTLKSSLYNGVASDKWSEVFNIRPSRDGIIAINELSYVGDSGSYVGSYHLGYSYGHTPLPEEQRSKEEPLKKVSRSALWMLVEQPVYIAPSGSQLTVLLHGGWSPESDCDWYGAVGVLWRGLLGEGDYIGFLYDRSLYTAGYETELELTYSMPTRWGTIQPALHRVYTPSRAQTIAMTKIIFEF